MYKILKKKKKLINFIQLINKEIKGKKSDNKNIKRKGGQFVISERR